MSHAFLDEIAIRVAAGAGGNGCVAFRREKYVPFGGPSGGDGGDGGSVLLAGTSRMNTLSPLRHQGTYRASAGGNGEGKNRHGASGSSLCVQVPAGTIISDADTGERLADLGDGEEVVVARGGRGGRGNARFATSTVRAPRKAEPGGAGQARDLRLELKLLADVGLVGLPNAGKSTLISVISAARPKVAPYPFTTLVPNLGVVDAGDFRSFVVADIPGLIEGSHAGQGLGDQFLRHVQRTSVLLHLVDVSGLPEETPARAVRTIERELEAFDPDLLERPRVLVATKIDSAAPRRLAALKVLAERRDLPFLAISAVTGAGVPDLVSLAARLVEESREGREASSPDPETRVVRRAGARGRKT